MLQILQFYLGAELEAVPEKKKKKKAVAGNFDLSGNNHGGLSL